MATKNKTRYAILGVLTVSDCSGYDIKKYCDKILSHFWHENYGHIYPVLNQLVEEGAIAPTKEEGPSRKKTYSITQKGREDFMEWLEQPAEYQPARSEFLLKLSFSNSMPKESILRMLEEYRKHHSDNLEKYRAMEAYLENTGRNSLLETRKIYVQAPLRFGILSCESAIKWCDEVMEML